jgi:FixJ family two-component response regulator
MVIAVVDDDRVLLDALARMLSASGYQPETFVSAKEFLRSTVLRRAECLVIDIELGDMSGLELVEQLAVAGSRIPVIFMSGSRKGRFRAEALRLDCRAYLYKPFPSILLLDAIERTVGRGLSSDGS